MVLQTLAEYESDANVIRSHVYEPLPGSNRIRVLVLHPAIGVHSQLEGTLVTCKINDKFATSSFEYEAISYVWGSSHLEEEILLDGRSAMITRSLAQALRAFRDEGRNQYFWADGICINQADFKEKNHQVQFMAAIFASATRVLAWLGNDLAHSFDPILAESGDKSEPSEMKFNEAALNAVGALLERPWFHRRWIIQEVVLSRHVKVYVGGKSIAWEVFMHVVNLLYLRGNWSSELVRTNMENVRAMDVLHLQARIHSHRREKQQGHHKQLSLLQLLLLFNTSACSDPRDSLFALLGLASEQEPRLQVDYLNSAGEVFAEFAHQHLLTPGRDAFQLLQCAGAFRGPSKTRLNPQSWIPEWTRTPRFAPLLDDGFTAGDGSKKFSISEDDVLTIKGSTLGIIGRKTRYSRGTIRESLFRNLLWSWVALMNDKCAYRDSEIVDALGFTLIADAALARVDRSLLGLDAPPSEERQKMLSGFRYLAWRAVNAEETDSDADNDGGAPCDSRSETLRERLSELLNSTSSILSRTSSTINPFEQSSGTNQSVSDRVSSLQRHASTSKLSRLPGQITPLMLSGPTIKRAASADPMTGLSAVEYAKLQKESATAGRDYLRLLSRTMSGRCLFRTVEGGIGIGPGDTHNGDIVVVLRGARTPFILRRNDFSRTFRLLGDAYVHGAMYGRDGDPHRSSTFHKHTQSFEID